MGGPRLNRYYDKLKPYYRLDYDKVEEPQMGATTASDSGKPQGLP